MNNSRHISEILNKGKQTFSFEFFPPKTPESSNQLFDAIKHLSPLNPSFVSVTYGAGGTTRDLTHDLVVKLQHEVGFSIVAHLTCVGSSKEEIKKILERYRQNKIINIMALRGDSPKGVSNFIQPQYGFKYASELVEFIKKYFPEMGIGVAGFPEGHPDTIDKSKSIDYLKLKVDSGADYICTQLFFDNSVFYEYREACEKYKITIPIIAGIMPITTRKGMERMFELAKGSAFPKKLVDSVINAKDDTEVEIIGTNWAIAQVDDLIKNNAAGVHFYTLNRSKATLNIYETLNINSVNK